MLSVCVWLVSFLVSVVRIFYVLNMFCPKVWCGCVYVLEC